MFLVCNVCKFSTPFPESEGAPEPDLFKCRKNIPTAGDKDKMAAFPIVDTDWECDSYRKKMVD